MLPEGTFRAARRNGKGSLRVVEVGDRKTPCVEVDLRIVEDGPLKNSAITFQGWLTDGAWKKTVEALRVLGWIGDDLEELPALADGGALANECDIVIEHETYNGKTRAKIAWLNAPGRSRAAAMSGSALSSFAQRLKTSVASVPMPEGVKPSSAPAARTSGGSSQAEAAPDDGIPPPTDADNPFA
jgi:hypothetical protein